jgi:hypothetical protein
MDYGQAMTPEFRTLLDALVEHDVSLVVVGGVAHGLESAKRAADRLKDVLDLAEIQEIKKRTPRT